MAVVWKGKIEGKGDEEEKYGHCNVSNEIERCEKGEI